MGDSVPKHAGPISLTDTPLEVPPSKTAAWEADASCRGRSVDFLDSPRLKCRLSANFE